MNRPWGFLFVGFLVAGSVLPSKAHPPVSQTENARTAPVHGTSSHRVTRVYIQPRGADDQSVIELRKRLISRGVERVNLFAPSMIIVCDVPESIDLRTLVDDPRYSLTEEADVDTRPTAPGSDDLRFVKTCYEHLRQTPLEMVPFEGSDGFDDVLRVLPSQIVEESKTRARLSAVSGAVQERNIQQNSELLTGDVLIRLVLPESDTHAEDWTEQALSDAASGAFAAALDFQTKFPNMELHFVLTTEPQVPTLYEPIQMVMNEHYQWISDVLARLGIPMGPAELMVHEYNNKGRRYYNTDWVFTAFIACSENAPNHRFADQFYTAYATLGGPYLVIPYPAGDNPFSIDPYLVFSTVFQHEMSHVFWALDEYPGPNNQSLCSSRTGYLAYENRNKVDELPDGGIKGCSGWETQLCIMWRAKEDLGRPICKYTQGQIGVVDEDPRNDIPDVFDGPPVVEFADAAVETIDTPDVTVGMKVVSQAVPNRNPFQAPEDRVSYAPPLQDATVTINGLGAIHLAPLDGRWDEVEEDLSISVKGIPVGTTQIAVVARNIFGRASSETVKKIYFLGIRFALFDVDPLATGIRVFWSTVGESFGARLDLHRIDASAGDPDTTLLVSDIKPSSQSGGMFRHYDFTDGNVTPGRSYQYFVKGYFNIVHSDTTVEYVTTSDTFEAQSMFPIPPGVLASYVSPNPFNQKTQISVRIPEAVSAAQNGPGAPYGAPATRRTAVRVAVYDVSGRPVRTIYDGQLFAGVKTFEWDGTNDNNERVPSGVYFIRTIAGPATEVRKVVVVR